MHLACEFYGDVEDTPPCLCIWGLCHDLFSLFHFHLSIRRLSLKVLSQNCKFTVRLHLVNQIINDHFPPSLQRGVDGAVRGKVGGVLPSQGFLVHDQGNLELLLGWHQSRSRHFWAQVASFFQGLPLWVLSCPTLQVHRLVLLRVSQRRTHEKAFLFLARLPVVQTIPVLESMRHRIGSVLQKLLFLILDACLLYSQPILVFPQSVLLLPGQGFPWVQLVHLFIFQILLICNLFPSLFFRLFKLL